MMTTNLCGRLSRALFSTVYCNKNSFPSHILHFSSFIGIVVIILTSFCTPIHTQTGPKPPSVQFLFLFATNSIGLFQKSVTNQATCHRLNTAAPCWLIIHHALLVSIDSIDTTKIFSSQQHTWTFFYTIWKYVLNSSSCSLLYFSKLETHR